MFWQNDGGGAQGATNSLNNTGARANVLENTGSDSGHSHNMSANFSGDATSVVQPYLTVVYIIKT